MSLRRPHARRLQQHRPATAAQISSKLLINGWAAAPVLRRGVRLCRRSRLRPQTQRQLWHRASRHTHSSSLPSRKLKRRKRSLSASFVKTTCGQPCGRNRRSSLERRPSLLPPHENSPKQTTSLLLPNRKSTLLHILLRNRLVWIETQSQVIPLDCVRHFAGLTVSLSHPDVALDIFRIDLDGFAESIESFLVSSALH